MLGAKSRDHFLPLVELFVLCLTCVGSQTPTSGTAPSIFEGNRMYAELAFVRLDGTLHKALAFVDLGSPSTILSEALFKELQLQQRKPLTFQVGDMAVRIDPSVVASDAWRPFSIAAIATSKRSCRPASCRNIRS
jgi:hypothetical protein